LPYDHHATQRILPPLQPTAMPEQPISRVALRARGHGDAQMLWRRIALLVGTLTLTAAAWYAPFELFAGDGLSLLEWAGLLLFGPLFIGIACWFCSALAGFVLLSRRRHDMLDLKSILRPGRLPRTALLATVRNEDVGAVYERLARMDRALSAQDANASFDFFVLSDTKDAACAAREWEAAQRASVSGRSKFYYRRRSDNRGRKAGNISDWVRSFGGGYEYMIVLDADSLMSAELLVGLVGAMESRPDLGVLQTTPMGVGGETLFARNLQFGIRLYGRVATAGVAWWSGNESLYWGHNAILRTRAFAEAAGLPRLEGPAPFGGDILSHDVVEGWFMRRAGWSVAMAPMLDGSYEECPPTMADEATRDRRWCQGNFQHLALLRAGGLHWLAKVQMLMAAMVYAAGPLWLAFIAVGVALRVAQGAPSAGEPWFSGGAERILELHWSIVLTIVMLFGPKVMGAALALANPVERKAFGGGAAIAGGLAIDFLISAAMAPVRMLFACRAVFETLAGVDTGWRAQRRSINETTWQDAWRTHRWHFAIGVATLLIAAPYAELVIWMAPILIGLVFSPAIDVVMSSAWAGGLARRFGLFVTPEESLGLARLGEPARTEGAARGPDWETRDAAVARVA
jgi:membrane glycosyltransferase